MVWPDAEINLSALLSHAPGADTEFVEEGLLSPSEDLLEAFGMTLVEPLRWDLTVRSTGGDDDFIVEGSVDGVAQIECRRCLKATPAEASASFILPMAYDPKQEQTLALIENEEEDELLVFSEPTVDFAPFLAQLFALELPLTVLCSETCRGLSIDGVDLNEFPDYEVPVQETETRSPFAALKDLEL